jgi:hypothetical protein
LLHKQIASELLFPFVPQALPKIAHPFYGWVKAILARESRQGRKNPCVIVVFSRGIYYKSAMKLIIFFISLPSLSLLAQDIEFNNRTGTFTNLEGRVFVGVTLVRADMDGLIWREGAGGGRVCFTNLHPNVLAEFGIPTNRISIAGTRAENRAASNVRARAVAAANAQAQLSAQAEADAMEATNAPARALAQQKQADADFIAALEARIAAAKASLRRAKAHAHDYNAANRYNDFAPYVYVKDTERVRIEEAEDRLKQMKAEFFRKYKTKF